MAQGHFKGGCLNVQPGEKYLDLIGVPLERDASGACNKPNLAKAGENLEGRPPETKGVIGLCHPTKTQDFPSTHVGGRVFFITLSFHAL